MKFKSSQVKGKGRGKLLGFPTINLKIPQNFKLQNGIYAAKVWIKGKEYIGALHFGPVPVFNQQKKTLEVFLIDTKDNQISDFKDLEIETLKYLRPILNFPSQEELIKQIEGDIQEIKSIILSQ